MDLWSLVKEGGFIMAPLLLCSILVWGVFFEKIWYLRKFSEQFQMLSEKAKNLVKESKINEAKGLAHSVDPLISKPFLCVLESKGTDREEWENLLHRRVKETQLGLKKYLWILGTIGTSAPFIGLFGTVVGIIKSFDSIAQSGKSGFSIVAADLGEALIATAAGIIVAVIAVVFYNYFQNRLNIVSTLFKNELEDLKDLV